MIFFYSSWYSYAPVSGGQVDRPEDEGSLRVRREMGNDDLRDCNDHDKIYIFEGPWNKNSEMFITIDVGPAMWDDPRCVGLDPHEDCQTSSFNEYRTKAYEGATVTLMTCGSTTQAGANLIGSDTALTTFSPLYATARDPATGERTIDVNDALAGIDPYDETEQAP